MASRSSGEKSIPSVSSISVPDIYFVYPSKISEQSLPLVERVTLSKDQRSDSAKRYGPVLVKDDNKMHVLTHVRSLRQSDSLVAAEPQASFNRSASVEVSPEAGPDYSHLFEEFPSNAAKSVTIKPPGPRRQVDISRSNMPSSSGI